MIDDLSIAYKDRIYLSYCLELSGFKVASRGLVLKCVEPISADDP